jgi:iron complex transport system ATP-binding protein
MLLRCLAGLPSAAALSGSGMLNGCELGAYEVAVLARLRAWSAGLVADVYGLSVFECVALGRWPYALAFGCLAQEDLDAVERVVCDWGLSALRDVDVARLSKGQQQRVALAQVAAQGVSCLLLDEPEQHLDPGSRALAWERFASSDKLVMIATHHLNLALAYATHWCVLMSDGQIKSGKFGVEVLLEDIDEAFGGYVPRIEVGDRVYFI